MKDTSREAARQRTEMLADLRNQHAEAFKHAQTLLKEQLTARKLLQKAMLGGAKTVPQLAESTTFPPHIVLWHIAAMKKYGLVVESGMDENGDYYLYMLSKEDV